MASPTAAAVTPCGIVPWEKRRSVIRLRFQISETTDKTCRLEMSFYNVYNAKHATQIKVTGTHASTMGTTCITREESEYTIKRHTVESMPSDLSSIGGSIIHAPY